MLTGWTQFEGLGGTGFVCRQDFHLFLEVTLIVGFPLWYLLWWRSLTLICRTDIVELHSRRHSRVLFDFSEFGNLQHWAPLKRYAQSRTRGNV